MMYSLCCELIAKQIRARVIFRLSISYTHVILRTYTLKHSKMWLPWLLSNYLATTKQFGVTLQWRVQKAVDSRTEVCYSKSAAHVSR